MAGGIERARLDISEGRLWKARDRLHGVIYNDPTNPGALDLLGETYFRMGDYPAAGRVWVLTERDDSSSRIAITSFTESFDRAGVTAMVRAIPAKARIEEYPEPVQVRLRDLRRRANEESGTSWDPPKNIQQPLQQQDSLFGKLVIPVLLLGTVGVWALGLVAIVYVVIQVTS